MAPGKPRNPGARALSNPAGVCSVGSHQPPARASGACLHPALKLNTSLRQGPRCWGTSKARGPLPEHPTYAREIAGASRILQVGAGGAKKRSASQQLARPNKHTRTDHTRMGPVQDPEDPRPRPNTKTQDQDQDQASIEKSRLLAEEPPSKRKKLKQLELSQSRWGAPDKHR